MVTSRNIDNIPLRWLIGPAAQGSAPLAIIDAVGSPDDVDPNRGAADDGIGGQDRGIKGQITAQIDDIAASLADDGADLAQHADGVVDGRPKPRVRQGVRLGLGRLLA